MASSSPICLPPFKIPHPSASESLLHPALSLPSYKPPSLHLHLLRCPQTLSRSPSRSFHRYSSDSDSPSPSHDSSIGTLLKGVLRMFHHLFNPQSGEATEVVELLEKEAKQEGFDDWNWHRWEEHFQVVDDQQRLLTLLKSQLASAVEKEDFEEAARSKVAIAAIASRDIVGSVISYLNKAVEEERYQDAAFVRDKAGAGLVGWWTGISDDRKDPYGCIVRISAEHGRYVARSYSPRQLAKSKVGAPLFEIFLILNESGDYKQKAVYLKRRVSQSPPSIFPRLSTSPNSINTFNPTGGKTDLFEPPTEEPEVGEEGDDSDTTELSPFGILQDTLPNLETKVLKVTIPGKLDQDSISFMAGLIDDDDDEEEKADLYSENVDDVGGTDESDDFDLGTGSGFSDREDQNEIAVKVVVGGLMQKLSSRVSTKDLHRVPAKLEKNGWKSFSLIVENDDDQGVPGSKNQTPTKGKTKFKGRKSPHRILFDLEKFVTKGEKIPMKVLKDVGDLISFTLKQAETKQPLSGSTTFSRIELPEFMDPLNGLYIGAQGPYSSEVIQLRRKFGQWKNESSTSGADLEFYEYVEAVKITGDPYVPAGEISFRAKVGKRYQLPHKGIIPEELGVIARYRGQGRLAEPGFRKPRWVDGELVILDGKYIKSGPVVGFVYWAPDFQFLVFYQRLRLEE